MPSFSGTVRNGRFLPRLQSPVLKVKAGPRVLVHLIDGHFRMLQVSVKASVLAVTFLFPLLGSKSMKNRIKRQAKFTSNVDPGVQFYS